jgi:hypothetical protein
MSPLETIVGKLAILEPHRMNAYSFGNFGVMDEDSESSRPTPRMFTDRELRWVITTLNELLGVAGDLRITVHAQRDEQDGIYFHYLSDLGHRLGIILSIRYDSRFNFSYSLESELYAVPKLESHFIPHVEALRGRLVIGQGSGDGPAINARFQDPEPSVIMRNGLIRLSE